MRRTGLTFLITIAICCSQINYLSAQKFDIGLDLGGTGFFGDLGGANFVGRPFFFDLESSLIKPAASFHFRYYADERVVIKGALTYTAVAGADSLIQPTQEFDPEWYRRYRNLSFQSYIFEASVTAEINLIRFIPGDMRSPFAPYIFLGLGLFHFNPTTIYKGETVALHPLHTEGEGFPSSGVKEYSLIQPVFPLGFGLRYSVSNNIILGFEYSNHFTRTDYIDDVSKTYVSQKDFNSYFASDPAKASLAYALSVRSGEIDSTGAYAYITAPGEERGDHKKDNYAMVQVSISFVFGGSSGHYTNQLGKYRRIQKRWLHG